MNDTSAINQQQLSLTLTREFSVDPETLFSYLTEPSHLVHWFAPTDDLTTEVHDLDLSVGGTYRVSMLDPANEQSFTVSGKYIEIDRPKRLVFSWHWESKDSDEVSRVTFEIHPTTSGSRLELCHDQFDGQESADKHNQGWNGCLDRLEKAIA